MFESLFQNVTEEEKNAAIANIVQHASPRQDFFLMLALSLAMAVFGVLLNSVVILIGSMLIAPLLYPVLSLALGVITSDDKLIWRSFITILKSAGIGLAAGLAISLIFGGARVANISMLGIFDAGASLMYAIVAVIAGFAAAFATTKRHLNETLSGIAIAVALVPPLAVAGVGLSLLNWAMVSEALLLFVVNVIGIMFSAMVVFAMFRFAVKQKVTHQAVKADEQVIAKEANGAVVKAEE